MRLLTTIIFSLLFTFTSFAKYEELPQIYKSAIDESQGITNLLYTRDSVNIRNGADTNAPIHTTVDRNTEIEAVTDVGGWVIIIFDGDYRFIRSDLLSTTKTERTYSNDDLYVLSHIIDAEMGVESWEDKLYTGSVVLNRVQGDPYWGNTIREVVFKRGQYQPTWSGSFYRHPSQESINAARYLLENGSQIPCNVVYQAEFKQGSGIWKKTKGAYYCYK